MNKMKSNINTVYAAYLSPFIEGITRPGHLPPMPLLSYDPLLCSRFANLQDISKNNATIFFHRFISIDFAVTSTFY